MHPNVVRQRLSVEIVEVIEARIGAPHAGTDGRIKALLELGLATRRVQGERGDDRELDGGIAFGPLVECVEQGIGLPDAERRPQNDAFSENLEDGLDARIAVLEAR